MVPNEELFLLLPFFKCLLVKKKKIQKSKCKRSKWTKKWLLNRKIHSHIHLSRIYEMSQAIGGIIYKSAIVNPPFLTTVRIQLLHSTKLRAAWTLNYQPHAQTSLYKYSLRMPEFQASLKTIKPSLGVCACYRFTNYTHSVQCTSWHAQVKLRSSMHVW